MKYGGIMIPLATLQTTVRLVQSYHATLKHLVEILQITNIFFLKIKLKNHLFVSLVIIILFIIGVMFIS